MICPRPRVAARAFTLIELIAVIVVLAILSGVAAASMTSVNERRVRFAAQQTAVELANLRERAMATGLATWIAFDAAQSTWISREDDPQNSGYAASIVLDDPLTGHPAQRNLIAEFGPAAQITAVDFDGGSVVGFDWMGRPTRADGSPLSGATGRVEVGSAHVVSVHADTGHVAISD